MGGHDHGHHQPQYTVPKADTYKIENAPELLKTQAALAKRGLKDPWLRNEVWRYDTKVWGTHGQRLTRFFFRGLPLGFAAFVATVGVEYMLGVYDDHGHGHGHSGGDHEHSEHK